MNLDEKKIKYVLETDFNECVQFSGDPTPDLVVYEGFHKGTVGHWWRYALY